MNDASGPLRLVFSDGASWDLAGRTRVMGVLNVTPDSFSDGGRHVDLDRALTAGRAMIADGADLIDVGGESTRPGAPEVSANEERARVLDLIRELRATTDCRISIDTRKAVVARDALDAGADVINDVSALGDPDMLPLAVERRVPVVLMHMRGTPETMQRDTQYDDVVAEVASFLRQRADLAATAGLTNGKIIVDPGVGFGKSVAGNLRLLSRLGELGRLGRPVLVGASRKSFIGKVLDLPIDQRLEGSLAVAAFASFRGAHIVRVHDVNESVRVVRMIDAIRHGSLETD